MKKFGYFIINEWLRLIKFYTVEYSRNFKGSQSDTISLCFESRHVNGTIAQQALFFGTVYLYSKITGLLSNGIESQNPKQTFLWKQEVSIRVIPSFNRYPTHKKFT